MTIMSVVLICILLIVHISHKQTNNVLVCISVLSDFSTVSVALSSKRIGS